MTGSSTNWGEFGIVASVSFPRSRCRTYEQEGKSTTDGTGYPDSDHNTSRDQSQMDREN